MTMNFVLFIDDAEHRAWAIERAVGIAEKHPSRLLILDATNHGDHASIAGSLRETETAAT